MEAAKLQIEQLRAEGNIPRKKVSECAKDLLEYCEKQKSQDMLLNGPVDGQNPFQEKKGCIVL